MFLVWTSQEFQSLMKLFSAAETDHNRADYWKFFAHYTPIAGQSFLEGSWWYMLCLSHLD